MPTNMMRRGALLAKLTAAIALGAAPAALGAEPPKLTRGPSLSSEFVAFLHGDDIWIAPRSGGAARRLTTGGTARGGPFFSPDGRLVAYAAVAGASTDIFVVPVEGGTPRRITWHPDAEAITGWSRDGREVTFASSRTSALRSAPKLFAVAVAGNGQPRELPLPSGTALSLSPDGAKAAYVPLTMRGWKGYRGGQAPYIWMADLSTLDIVKLPHTDASDWNPMWIGDKIYFLSDRDGKASLYAFDIASGAVERVLENKGRYDFQSAQAGPGGIVVDAMGELKLFDIETRQARSLVVRMPADGEPKRREVEFPGARATARALSPDGSAYALEARGEIFVAPNAAGASARNLSSSPAVSDRSPAWLPDGRSLSYVSDASGEYRLVVRSADGSGTPSDYALGEGRGYFSDFNWSPDGRRLAYRDQKANLWIFDRKTGRSANVVQDVYGLAIEDLAWSPDGKLLAYVSRNAARLGVVWAFDVETGRTKALTDGRSDAYSPAFDPAGGQLYFLASADRPRASTGTMASNGVPFEAGAYAAGLADPAAPVFRRLSAPPRKYAKLAAGETGVVYLTEGLPGEARTIWRVADGQTQPLLANVDGFDMTLGGRGALVRRRGATSLIALAEIKPGENGDPAALPAGRPFAPPALRLTVDLRAEWKQIYREAWRHQRDLFYAPHYNGLDIAETEALYGAFVPGLASRGELTYLMREAFSELRVSHMTVTEPPRDDPAYAAASGVAELQTAGLLGADFRTENGRYRFQRVYRGDIWVTETVGPLGLAGVGVREGDYLIAVGGREVRAEDNIDRALEGLADKSVEIRVAADPSGADARTYKVVPVGNELAIRQGAWIAERRRLVGELSGGKLGYIYFVNTGLEGYSGFNSQYLAQTDKQGVVIDERNNAGGPIAEYVIERLRRMPLTQVWPPDAKISQPFPTDHLNGPAAMIVNETAGSGGDITPYMFRKAKLGPLIGKRTWGGTIGAVPAPLLDGAFVNVPRFPISDQNGNWSDLEGYGVSPDIVVELEPKPVAEGRDPQLETAVKAVLGQLAADPPAQRRRPPSREQADGGPLPRGDGRP